MTAAEELRDIADEFHNSRWLTWPDALGWGNRASNSLAKAAQALEAALSERDAHSKEIERLRDCLRERPNTLLIAHEDGDHKRLSRVAAKAIDRAEASEARVTALEKVLIEIRDNAGGGIRASALARASLSPKLGDAT